MLRVANARFTGTSGLVLLCVAVDRLTAPLRYEIGDPGSEELFPHLYGALNTESVVEVADLAEGPEGFELPAQAAR